MLMSPPKPALLLEHHPIRTWFGIGGGADRYCVPQSLEHLRQCFEFDPALRVLGDGANLLVDDDGVRELVIELAHPEFTHWTIDDRTGAVRVGAGANLPKLINECVRRGLSGIETLAGIPATLGGALVMNAGGAFGQIADVVKTVHALNRTGKSITLERSQIAFDYRHSGLKDLILTGAELTLNPADPAKLRERQLEIMQFKKRSQPMAEKSAGCCFKNPVLTHALPQAPDAAVGKRISAGRLIDLAGLKGSAVRAAEVSPVHGNFLVTKPGATARDVIELMDFVTARVLDRFGIQLEREVVVWRSSGHP